MLLLYENLTTTLQKDYLFILFRNSIIYPMPMKLFYIFYYFIYRYTAELGIMRHQIIQ